jgi:hypothetical protein
VTTAPKPDGRDDEAHRIAAVVSGCADVAGMSAGLFGEVRTYLPGGTIPGVRIGDGFVEVHVVVHLRTPLPEVGGRIAAALAPLLAGRAWHVVIDDVAIPGEDDPTSGGQLTAGSRDVGDTAGRQPNGAGEAPRPAPPQPRQATW